MNVPSGNVTSMSRRLCSRAPLTTSACRCPGGAWPGPGPARSPRRNAPVIERGSASTASSEPFAMISPPCSPAPGPMSMTQSAVRIVSSSCSTTRTVLPRSRSRVSVAISFALSRWWRPIDGSSRMYRTPISVVPIWVASRIRCASPPDRLIARAVERSGSRGPTSTRNPSRATISLRTWRPIVRSRSVTLSPSVGRPVERVGDRQRRDLGDVPAVDGDGQRPRAAAGGPCRSGRASGP